MAVLSKNKKSEVDEKAEVLLFVVTAYLNEIKTLRILLGKP